MNYNPPLFNSKNHFNLQNTGYRRVFCCSKTSVKIYFWFNNHIFCDKMYAYACCLTEGQQPMCSQTEVDPVFPCLYMNSLFLTLRAVTPNWDLDQRLYDNKPPQM